MKEFLVEQGSQEWFDLHRGIPTASQFGRVLTYAKRAKGGQAKFIAELIAQTLSTLPMGPSSEYQSAAMRRGHDLEHQARLWYSMDAEVEVRQIGFALSDCGRFGASPDGMVGSEACLEIKCPCEVIQVQRLTKGEVPKEYIPQIHGEMIVTGCKEAVFVSYCPALKGVQPLKIKVTRNEYTDALQTALDEFWTAYQEALRKVRGG